MFNEGHCRDRVKYKRRQEFKNIIAFNRKCMRLFYLLVLYIAIRLSLVILVQLPTLLRVSKSPQNLLILAVFSLNIVLCPKKGSHAVYSF